MPLVSVVIPTYNSARYLADAISSALAQTMCDLEIIVVDDGSTDDTPSLMSQYSEPVRYMRQENRGVALARNRGMKESVGQYIAFLDADDTWLPNKLELQLAALKDKPECKACYSAFLVVDSSLSPLGVRRSKRVGSALEDLLLRGNVIGSLTTVLCERKLFEEVGGFDPELSQCADWDMWIRLARLTEFLYIDEPLATYRQHEANMSRNAPLLERDSLRALEKGFSMPGLPAALLAKRRRAFARNYMVLAGTYFHSRHYRDFIRCATRAVAMDLRQAEHLLGFPFRVAARLRANRSSSA
jgi:glycosyltransferase involved in cell wall biosynthesis